MRKPTNSKCCDLVPLLVQRKNCLFVDVVGGCDDQLFKPVKTVLCRHLEIKRMDLAPWMDHLTFIILFYFVLPDQTALLQCKRGKPSHPSLSGLPDQRLSERKNEKDNTHKRPVAQIVERHCNGTEVQDATPGEQMFSFFLNESFF